MSETADKIKKCYQHSEESLATVRDDSAKAFRYLTNNPYTADDISKAAKYKKPLLRYNILMPEISTLLGNEQLTARRPRIKPQTLEFVDIADTIQGRWNTINDEQDVEELLQVAFVDALTLKIGGWIERTFEMNSDGYLDFIYRLANPFQVYPDPETRTYDYTLSHCKWIVKETWETLDVIKERYGISPSRADTTGFWNRLSEIIKRFSENRHTQSPYYDRENDRVKILEMQERTARKIYICALGESYIHCTPSEFQTYKKRFPEIQYLRTSTDSAIKVGTLIPYLEDEVIIDDYDKSLVPNFNTFPCFSFGINIQISECTSLVDMLIDPQDDINKGKSQLRDYVTQILSSPLFVSKLEKDANSLLKRKGNQPGLIVELNDLANRTPKRTPPENVQPDILVNQENSYQYVQRVSHVSQEYSGQQTKSGDSGVLFQKKIERAAAAINPYYKNLSNLRKTLVKDFVDNFPLIYSELDRLTNIKQDKINSQVILNLQNAGQVLNDVRNPSLYVELDEGEDNITTKEENFNTILAISNVVGASHPELLYVRGIVETAPIPGKEKEKWLEFIDQQMQSGTVAAAEQGQIDQTRQLLENQKIERDMLIDQEKINIEREKNRQPQEVTL